MFTSLALIFLASALAPLLGRHKYFKFLLLAPILIAFSHYFKLWSALDGQSLIEAPFSLEENAFGFRVSFVADGLSLVLAQLISGVGAFVMLYTLGYFSAPAKTARFASHLLMFMGAMLGVVLSNNLLLIFVFWELTSVSSYLLIGFNHEDAAARKSALQALLVTGIGGLCLLAGFLILGSSAGTFELSQFADWGGVISSSPHYGLITVLIFLGCLTKSAQFPFHFWLPNAMTAPTPASSYLHSATMVKAGIFLLMRLSPILGGTVLWHQSLTLVGGLTLALASALALIQFDLKKVLAYTTLAALGTLVLLLGVNTPLAAKACILFTLAHALYKAPLFLIVGNLDHECKTRDLRKLSGIRTLMPMTFVAALLCCVAMASLPPFFSFIAKETVLEALHEFPILISLVLISSVVFVLIACVFVMKIFLGKQPSVPGHEAPWPMVVAPLGLALLAIFLSAYPDSGLLGGWMDSASLIIAPQTEEALHLAYWHGFNALLFLSVVAIVSGVLLFKLWGKRQRLIESLNKKTFFGPSEIYDWSYKALLIYSKKFFALIQHGFLYFYLITIVLFLIFLVRVSLSNSMVSLSFSLGDVNFFELTMAGAIIGGAFLAVRSASAVAALTALGLVGFGIAFLYLINGAPDLALTQFLVETLTLVLLVLSFRVLPRKQERSSAPYSIFVAVVSGVFASAIAYMTLYSAQNEARSSIRDFFGEFSYSLAHGRNVVNVILVDFRGLDTMGEITVLSIAAVGVVTLLTWNKVKGTAEK